MLVESTKTDSGYRRAIRQENPCSLFLLHGDHRESGNRYRKEAGGKLYRITPATAYTSADLDWNDKASRSSVEMADEKSRPALGGETIDLKDYDVVLLGYPIWWDLCPRPVNTFLEKYDFAGKTVIPFATSGGSSITGSVKQLKKLYPKIEWKEGRLFNGGTANVAGWSKQIIEKL